MTNNKTIFLPQSQNEIIDSWGLKEKPSEFVLANRSDGHGLLIITRHDVEIHNAEIICSMRTLEELLDLLPCNIKDGDKNNPLLANFWHKSFYYYGFGADKMQEHKDPKQAVFAMAKWCKEQGYLEEAV